MTILEPQEDMFKILEDSQPSNIIEHSPPTLTAQKSKPRHKTQKATNKSRPKLDPIAEEINRLMFDYLTQSSASENDIQTEGGFKEFAEKHASSSLIIERLGFKDIEPKKEKPSKGKSAKKSNSRNKKDKKANSGTDSANNNASNIKSESQTRDTNVSPTFKKIPAKQSETQKVDTKKTPIFEILFCKNEIHKEESSAAPVVTEIFSKDDRAQNNDTITEPVITKILTKQSQVQDEDVSVKRVNESFPNKSEAQIEESSTAPVVTKILSKKEKSKKKATSTGPIITKILTRNNNDKHEGTSLNSATENLPKQDESHKVEFSKGPTVTKILSKKDKLEKKAAKTEPVITKILTREKADKQDVAINLATENLHKQVEAHKEDTNLSSASENVFEQNEAHKEGIKSSPAEETHSKEIETQKEESSTDPVVNNISSKKDKSQKIVTTTSPVVTKILTRKKEIKQENTSSNSIAEILSELSESKMKDASINLDTKSFAKKDRSQVNDIRKDPDFKLILTEIHKAQKEDTSVDKDTEILSNESEAHNQSTTPVIYTKNICNGKRAQVINFRQLEEGNTLNQNVSEETINNLENGATEKSSMKKKKDRKKKEKEKENKDKTQLNKDIEISLFTDEKKDKSDANKQSKEVSKKDQPSKPKASRKNKCEDYISEYKVPYFLKSGKLLSGEFRINSNARWEGFITPEGDAADEDVLIPGFHNQNRALYGDLVAVELYSKEEGHKEIEAVFNEKFAQHFINRGLRVGKVVRILNRDPSLTFVGTILPSGYDKSKINDEKDQSQTEAYNISNSFVFIPTNIRIPFFIIPKHGIPPTITENWGTFKNQIFEAKIVNWSKHERHPLGKVTKCLGPMGDLRSTQRNILIDNTIIDKPFSKVVLDDLPKTPYKIKAKHMKNRIDFRKECVFTIDPSTARDLDDAVSIKRLPNGNFKVGVHIADVSHFITPGSALDKEALKRGTSTYLVNRVIPMLPELLCQDLCSLNPGVDRLTFSVIWELDSEGNRITTSFAKAVIKSCCKLAYEDAQEVIEEKNLPSDLIVYGDHKVSTIEQNIRDLYNLSKVMRKRRFDSGAVQINRFKLSIQLDENGFPESFKTYQGKASNKLIEEFMLLANMSVAEKIYQEYPAEAMMRSHPDPIPGRLDVFSHYTKEIDMPFIGESSSALTEYFDSIEDDTKRFCLENMAVKTFLMRAKYLCNTKISEPHILHHFALNVDYYTHFTSPIRRYPDLVVHRQLMSILCGDKKFNHGANKESISNIAHQCNNTKFKAKTAQEQSTQLYLAHYINRQVNLTKKPIPTTGYIFNLDRNYMELVIPEYALEETIKWDVNFNFDSMIYSSKKVILNHGLDVEIIKNRPDLSEAKELFEKPLSEDNEVREYEEANDDTIAYEDIEDNDDTISCEDEVNQEDNEANEELITCGDIEANEDTVAYDNIVTSDDTTAYKYVENDGDVIAYEDIETGENDTTDENDKNQEDTSATKSLQDSKSEKTTISTTFELFRPVPLLLTVSMNHVTPRIRIYVDDLPTYKQNDLN